MGQVWNYEKNDWDVNGDFDIKVEVAIWVLIDAKGDVSHAVTSNYDQSITIGGFNSEGEYVQFDSYEAYYAHDFFEKQNGMTLTVYRKNINLNQDGVFN